MKTTKLKRAYTAAVVLVVFVSSICMFSGSSEAAPSFAYFHVEMEDGTPASGANVTLTNIETGVSIYEITDGNGDCAFQRDVDSFIIPGIQFAAYNQTIRVDVTKDEYTTQDSFKYSWVSPTELSKEWVNITLEEPETKTISPTALLGIGIGIGIFSLIIIVILSDRTKEKNERSSKKRGKRKQR